MGDPESLFPNVLSMHSEPQESGIPAENWLVAEEITNGLLLRILPTAESDEKRRSITDYVIRLTRNKLNIEVLPTGSVPLKTYLPGGDIDLTALGRPGFEVEMVEAICSMLQSEKGNNHAEFLVKDVQLIDGKVKLVQCLVQGIKVDISANKLGGISTLCFLELVDRYISNQHLFKRSIVLVKAWCYYESRLSGACHGLLSTYALETLVMCIFHLFHSSLNGPFAVLHKFLEYFSKFDWNNYCVSVYGPVPKSSQQGLVAEEHGWGLFNNEDFKKAVDLFSVSIKVFEYEFERFEWKSLNILDPLNGKNNIGKSVNEGTSKRIRGAFEYGSGILNGILLQPKDLIAKELCIFFTTIIEMGIYGGGPGPELRAAFLASLQTKALDKETPSSSLSASLSLSNLKVEIVDARKISPSRLTNSSEDLCTRIRKMNLNARSSGSKIKDTNKSSIENEKDKAERSEVSSLPWLNLVGEYDLHHRSLLFAMCTLQSLGAIITSSAHQWQSMYLHLGATAFGPGLPFNLPEYFPAVSPYLSIRLEDPRRYHGTGTFIPRTKMGYSANKERRGSRAPTPRSHHTPQGNLYRNNFVHGAGNSRPICTFRPPRLYLEQQQQQQHQQQRFLNQQHQPQQQQHFLNRQQHFLNQEQQQQHFLNQGSSHFYQPPFTAPAEWRPPFSVPCADQVPGRFYRPSLPERPYHLRDRDQFPALPGHKQQR